MTQVAPGKSRIGAPRTGGTTDSTTTEGREPPAADKPAPKPAAPSPEPEPEAADAVMGLDMVLVDGARGPLRRFVPPARTTLAFAKGLAAKPDVVGKRARYLA